MPTVDPDGKPFAYKLDETVYRVEISDKGVLTMKKKDAAGAYNTEVFKVKTKEATETSAAEYQYRVLNTSEGERKIILRKVNDSFAAVKNAVFQIFRFDGTPVSSGIDGSGNPVTTFTSTDSGVYFIGKLPYGIYYLHETAPAEKWFILTVDSDVAEGSRDGVQITGPQDTDPRTGA